MANEKFSVVSGMSLPVPARGRKAKPLSDVYPFADMAVGDSFIVAGKKNIQLARNAGTAFAKVHGPKWKFVTRDISGMTLDGVVQPAETYGVWRAVPVEHQGPVTGTPMVPTDEPLT